MGVLENNGKKNSLGKDGKNVIKNEMKILELKSKITKIKCLVDGLESRMEETGIN